jgi:putative nucleotidyltransferase with HDIG domain
MIASAPIDLDALLELELPPMPGVALKVAALTQDLDASTRKIADAIGLDPILATRILRAANSPLYCFERSVVSLPTAVTALGNETIYSLVFMSAASDAFKGRRTPLEAYLWEHAVAVAMAAREVMIMLKLRGLEEGFLCGLLHDFGKLLLLRHSPKEYENLLIEAVEGDLLSGEQGMFGYNHAQVGALAVKRWNLPEEISHAIYFHHQPSQANHGILMARVVDVADQVAYRAGVGDGQWDSDLTKSESVMALNLTVEQIDDIVDKTKASAREAYAMFG